MTDCCTGFQFTAQTQAPKIINLRRDFNGKPFSDPDSDLHWIIVDD